MPLAFHVTLLGLTALMPFGIARIYALFALALVAVHVVAGILVGGGDWRDFGALLWAPFYVAWKLAASTQNSAVSSEPGTLGSDRSLKGNPQGRWPGLRLSTHPSFRVRFASKYPLLTYRSSERIDDDHF